MIYTVTFNPALDYVVGLSRLHIGVVNRTSTEDVFYGGKGINVSVILRELGIESVALGFIAGFTGDEIEERVRNLGISTDFIRLPKGLSRINIKIKAAAEEETELNGQGPDISPRAVEQLFEQLKQLKDKDTLVLAGSIPNSLPDDIYERIIEALQPQDIRIVVDATKELLRKVLKYHPFLIKPNNHELGDMFGVELTSKDEIKYYSKKLQTLGARNVLVSMAGDGAILLDENGQYYEIRAPKGVVLNSVGAGDSMVAGFLAGYLKSSNYETALKVGTAAGSATAFSKGLAGREFIEKMELQLKDIKG